MSSRGVKSKHVTTTRITTILWFVNKGLNQEKMIIIYQIIKLSNYQIMASGLINEINNNYLQLISNIRLFQSKIKSIPKFNIKSLLNYHINDELDNRINSLIERLDIHINIINKYDKTDKTDKTKRTLYYISLTSLKRIENYMNVITKNVDLYKIYSDFITRDYIEIEPKYINYFLINCRKIEK